MPSSVIRTKDFLHLILIRSKTYPNMHKFVFILYVFLLTGTAWADDTDKNELQENKQGIVQKIKNDVVGVVNKLMKQVHDKVGEIQEATFKTGKELWHKVQKIMKAVYDKIVKAHNKVNFDVAEAIKEAVDYNVTECKEVTEAFSNTGVQALAEVSRCVTDIIENADGFMENVRHSSHVVLKNLTNIKGESELCVENAKGFTSLVQAFVCVNMAAAKGTWAATTNVPALLRDLGQLTWKITTSLAELGMCTTMNGIKKVNEGSKVVVAKVKECIEARKKLSETRKENRTN